MVVCPKCNTATLEQKTNKKVFYCKSCGQWFILKEIPEYDGLVDSIARL